MKDAFGVEIQVGDSVAAMKTKEFNQYTHSDLIKLTVIGFTPSMVKLQYGSDKPIHRMPHRVSVLLQKKGDSRLID